MLKHRKSVHSWNVIQLYVDIIRFYIMWSQPWASGGRRLSFLACNLWPCSLIETSDIVKYCNILLVARITSTTRKILGYIKWLHLYARTDLLLSQSNCMANIYSIQTGRINRQIVRPCKNVNKTFIVHKCRKNEPNWKFCLFDKDGQVLSDQNDGTNKNISPNRTKANDEANKVSSKRERIQDFIEGQK